MKRFPCIEFSSKPTDPSGSIAAIGSKAAGVMRIKPLP
jgi:hypothetical protein